MNTDPPSAASERRLRLALRAVLARVLVLAALIVTLYYVIPLDALGTLQPAILLVVWVALFVGASAVGMWAVSRSADRSILAIEAFAMVAVFSVMTFAAGYYVMHVADPGSFTDQPLTRTDTLYFTVTVLSTVGFGDITAVSQTARVAVTVQMVLNLVFLGVGVKLLTTAVKLGRARHAHPEAAHDTDKPAST
jgi:voltage-gated potassium channel